MKYTGTFKTEIFRVHKSVSQHRICCQAPVSQKRLSHLDSVVNLGRALSAVKLLVSGDVLQCVGEVLVDLVRVFARFQGRQLFADFRYHLVQNLHCYLCTKTHPLNVTFHIFLAPKCATFIERRIMTYCAWGVRPKLAIWPW